MVACSPRCFGQRSPRVVLGLLPLALTISAACGPSVPKDELRRALATAIERPVSSAAESAEHSQTVQAAVDGDALMRLRRAEIERELGRGSPCSRHPRCRQLGFRDHDWVYLVGAMGEGYGGAVPMLIVGFDREGVVTRVWNLRTH